MSVHVKDAYGETYPICFSLVSTEDENAAGAMFLSLYAKGN